MSDKQFFNNLSATYADVRRLDAKKINLKGKNILEYIDESKTIILDERGTEADDELDIWNSYVTEDENGNVIIDRSAKPKEHTYEEMTDEQKELLLNNAVQVIDNEVLDGEGNHLMYWQTDGLTNAFYTVDKDNDGITDMELSVFNHYDYIEDDILANHNLTSFSSDLSSLTNGSSMFYECSQLATFSSDLSSLTNGLFMFSDCVNLTSFSTDLPSLTEGSYMFEECDNLTTFSSDLSSLTSGGSMFMGCYNLTSFSTDLPSLTEGSYMFAGCTNLTSFNSDLSSLTNGIEMFFGCKLDSLSIDNIILSLPQQDSSGIITIGIGIPNTDEAKQAFAEECYYEDWADLNADFNNRNWIVQWQFNGEASTFDLRSPRPSTAVYAKLEEVIMPTDENERKPYYKYTSTDGTKFYNIHWYHESNMEDESYTLFDSLEAAIESYNVVLKS